MANEQNLIKPGDKTHEQLVEQGRKGGLISVENRRRRKTLKEELLLLLASGDTQKNISVALIQKALNGDVKAFEVIRDSVGEKPVDKQEVKQVDTDWFIEE